MPEYIETEYFFEPFRQSSSFVVNLRGHWSGIPNIKEDYNNKIFSQLDEISNSRANYNVFYDSFFAPMDFKISAISVKMPKPITSGSNLLINILVDGSKVENCQVRVNEFHNIKIYSEDCDVTIYEDSFVEIVVESDDYSSLTFNENNIVVSISGCFYAKYYKQIWADRNITVATTENVQLTDLQIIDGYQLKENDTIFVGKQNNTDNNGIYIAKSENWELEDLFSDLYEASDGTPEKYFILNGETRNSYDYCIQTIHKTVIGERIPESDTTKYDENEEDL